MPRPVHFQLTFDCDVQLNGENADALRQQFASAIARLLRDGTFTAGGDAKVLKHETLVVQSRSYHHLTQEQRNAIQDEANSVLKRDCEDIGFRNQILDTFVENLAVQDQLSTIMAEDETYRGMEMIRRLGFDPATGVFADREEEQARKDELGLGPDWEPNMQDVVEEYADSIEATAEREAEGDE